jgi:hypothetical protein
MWRSAGTVATAVKVTVISLIYGPLPASSPCIKQRSIYVAALAAMCPGFDAGDEAFQIAAKASTPSGHKSRRNREEATGTWSNPGQNQLP